MEAILVRIGIDHVYGGWNAPVSTKTGEFVYIPIPESQEFHLRDTMATKYSDCEVELRQFCKNNSVSFAGIRYPEKVPEGKNTHLDPDFFHLTYGDNGERRGAGIAKLRENDLLVFYAGLRPIEAFPFALWYGLVGLFVIEEVIPARTISPDRYGENAHTRKSEIAGADIIVRAKRGLSGRLQRSLLIGEFRDRAYRVRKDILQLWGGLTVKNGYIQRSIVPPQFIDAPKFLKWFEKQGVSLLERNN